MTTQLARGHDPAPRRRRSAVVTVGIVAVATTSITGCSSRRNDYAQICAAQPSEVRVQEQVCDQTGSDDGGYSGAMIGRWYYIKHPRAVTPMGQVVSGGSYTKPREKRATVHRGGCGSGKSSFGG